MAKGFKSGGRVAGSTNRLSSAVRETLAKGFNGEFEKIAEYMREIDCPKEKLEIMMKVLPYLCPKLSERIDTEDEARPMVLFQQNIPQPGKQGESEDPSLRLVAGNLL